MTRHLLILGKPEIRAKAKRWIDGCPPGTRVEFKAPKRTLDQNALMWVLLGELAEQLRWYGFKLTDNDWKLIMLDGLKREMRIVPNIDGTGFVNLSQSSSDLSVPEMIDMIDLIYAFGAQHGVKFNDPLDMGEAA